MTCTPCGGLRGSLVEPQQDLKVWPLPQKHKFVRKGLNKGRVMCAVVIKGNSGIQAKA